MTNSSVRAIRDDRKGNIAVMMAFLALPVSLAIGGAIDYGRWFSASQVTVAALDSAVIGGAKYLVTNPDDPDGAITLANKLYQASTKTRLPLLNDDITFTITDNNQGIEATGSANIETTFLSLAGIDQLSLANSAAAQLPKAKVVGSTTNLEVAVMLDVTGSMCDDGVGPCTSSIKMDGLKAAAKKLINIVVQEDQSEIYSKVSLVPFSTRVRVGPDGGGGPMMSALTDLDPTWTGWKKQCVNSTGGGGSEAGGNWQCLEYEAQHKENWKIMPCVTDRFYNSGWDFDMTDDAPGNDKWMNAHDGGRMPESMDSAYTPEPTKSGTKKEWAATHWNYNSSGTCADIAGANEIMPLSSDKLTLKARVDALSAYGATAGPLGTAWSWYTLSPKWNDVVWTGDTRPGSYAELTETQPSGAPKLRKVAVLMTDGVYNTYRSWKGQDKSWMSETAKQMCTNMKAQGIEIYTVGLALDELPAAERAIAIDTLQSCGTDISHFYNTLNVSELLQAFEDIGVSMRRVSLVR